MNYRLRTTLFFAIFSCFVSCQLEKPSSGDFNEDNETLYSPEAIREDFEYLYETLQATAYDLFLNTEKSNFDKEYKRIHDSIREPMSYLQANRLFQPFVALARFSHCKVDFPSAAFEKWYREGGHFFPFDITFAGDRMLVTANWSGNRDISPGDEILAINGKSIEQVLNELLVYISGENVYAKRTMLEISSLMDYYWYAFGEFGAGTVRIKKPTGQVADLLVNGIDLAQYSGLAKSVKQVTFMREGREFRFIGDIAYLRPGIFLNASSSDISKQEAFEAGEFLDFMETAFTEIAQEKSENLILDLRGNDGGDNSFSDPMIAYFADKPFQIASNFRVRTSQITKEFWKDIHIPSLAEMKNQIMTLENGERFEAKLKRTEPRDDLLGFRGKVFVLIDRFSFSNAAVVAAIIQDYNFGFLIGEETSYVPSSCAAIHTFELPHTQMGVVFPKACSTRPNGDPSMRGVIPDLEVSDDVFTEEDEVLDRALELIRENRRTSS